MPQNKEDKSFTGAGMSEMDSKGKVIREIEIDPKGKVTTKETPKKEGE